MLDGHGSPDKYMERASQLGMSSLAITDHGNVAGILDFYQAGQEHGVKPILGEEFYQARKTRFDHDEEELSGKTNADLGQRGPYHLIVLARNEAGYKNLIKMSSQAYLTGFYGKPRIDHQLIAEHAEGLTVLSGCLSGEIQRALLRDNFDFALDAAGRMQDIVGKENYFIEIQDHDIPEQRYVRDGTIEIAKRLNALIVPTGDCHYVHKEDWESHDTLLCIQTGAKKEQEGRFKFAGPHFYLQSYEEMLKKFPAEWLANTLAIGESVDLKLNFGTFYFPEFPIPDGYTYDTYLDKCVWEGLKERYGWDLPQAVVDRANYELDVVKKMGFQSYFLVVEDLVRWAREHKIRMGVGRGSAASSIISYALRITGLDPLKFNLLFERFLVPGRKSMPDIDLDMDDRYRDKIIAYSKERYGSDHVANICTFTSIAARSAIRDSARVLDYEYVVGDKIAKLVPEPVQGFSKSLKESLDSPDLRKVYDTDDDARKIIDSAMAVEGVIRQTGIHAAGIVIAQDEITNFLPVMQDMKKGIKGPVITQWDMDWVEKNGILKIDFLGLRNLAVIDIAIQNIKDRHGIEIETDEIPLDDPATYDALCTGESLGMFQIEGGGMRSMMVSMKPSCIEDLMALVSLYRPGPLGSHMDKTYIARKHGNERVVFDTPELESILKNTYGVMLYQENILSISRELANFTAGEADDLRKAMGKKQKDKIGLFREKFVEGAYESKGIDRRIANKIYSDIEFFGAYGFNIAHAASYGVTAFWTAYLKTHYPVEYMAALLSTVSDKPLKLGIYLNECRRMGITVYPPSINRSEEEFTVLSDNEILYGLISVRGVGEAICKALISCRDEPYQNIYDFMRRVDPQGLNKGVLEALIESGAFDEIIEDQPVHLMSRDVKMEVLANERNRLGAYVSDHPVIGIWDTLEPHITHRILNLEDAMDGERVKIGGLISTVDKKTTKRGDTMYIMSLEDISGAVEVIVFPKEAKRYGNTLREGLIALVEGRLQRDGDEENSIDKLISTDISYPEISQYQSGRPIYLNFADRPGVGILNKIHELIESNPGDSQVYIKYPEYRHTITLKMQKPTSKNIENNLKLLVQSEKIGV